MLRKSHRLNYLTTPAEIFADTDPVDLPTAAGVRHARGHTPRPAAVATAVGHLDRPNQRHHGAPSPDHLEITHQLCGGHKAKVYSMTRHQSGSMCTRRLNLPPLSVDSLFIYLVLLSLSVTCMLRGLHPPYHLPIWGRFNSTYAWIW